MRKLLSLAVVLLFIAALSGYAVWTQQRPVGHYLSDLRSQIVLNQGEPGTRGNLLGIQPELFPGDYQSVERLRLKLAAYLEKARSQGLLNDKTIVVLPDHIGTWLLAVGEKPELYRVRTLHEALTWLAASNPLQLARALLAAEGEDRLADALLRMKAENMAHDYQALFGGLAKAFGITLVAGSIVLPEPSLENGRLSVGAGPLYNLSLVFGPDGIPLGQPQRQAFPRADAQGFSASAPSALAAVVTPAGRLDQLMAGRLTPRDISLFAHSRLWGLGNEAGPRPGAQGRLKQEPGARLFNFWL